MLDHYFLHFYTILRFVDESTAFDYDEEGKDNLQYAHVQKYHYASVLRATLSRYELVLLYYNGLSNFGREKLKPLLKKYAMLNNLNWYLLTLTLENRKLCNISEDKTPRRYLQENGLTGTDFEFYLADEEENSENQYKLSAFCTNKQEKERLMKMIEVRDVYMKNANGIKID